MNACHPINFRTFLVVAVCVFGAVLCSYLYIFVRSAGIAVFCVYSAALSALFIYYSIRVRCKTARLRIAAAWGISLILSVSAFAFATTYINERESERVFAGERDVIGRVCAIDVRNGDYRADLENVTFDGKSASGILRITIRAANDNVAEFIECGDLLQFNAKISIAELIDGYSVNGSHYRTDIRYYCYVDSDDLQLQFGEPTAIESFLDGWRELLTENMGDKYGNIAFSMLTGDKHALDTDITDYFSAAGLGHIMAVSGLHIGFLVALIELLLSRLRRSVRFGITTAVLIAYVILADFSPSVIRAAIMCVISMLSVFVGGRRDMLSSLSCAFSLILAFKPLYLFEAGFILSFGAIFGIAVFARSISGALIRHNANRKVSNAIGSSVAVQIGITPAEISIFGRVEVLALAVNSVLLPYISVVFVSTLLLSVIGAIPGCGAVLALPKYLLMPLDYAAIGISEVPFSSFDIGTVPAAFLCYPVMFCASEFFMMPRGKTAVAIASAVVCVMFCCFGWFAHGGEKASSRNASDAAWSSNVIVYADNIKSPSVSSADSLSLPISENLRAIRRMPGRGAYGMGVITSSDLRDSTIVLQSSYTMIFPCGKTSQYMLSPTYTLCACGSSGSS